MFIDTSVSVAILTHELKADGLADRLEGTHGCMTSPIAVITRFSETSPDAAIARQTNPQALKPEPSADRQFRASP